MKCKLSPFCSHFKDLDEAFVDVITSMIHHKISGYFQRSKHRVKLFADTKERPHHCCQWHQCPDGSCKDFLERGWYHRVWNDVWRWQLSSLPFLWWTQKSGLRMIAVGGCCASGQDGTGVWYGYFQSASCHAFFEVRVSREYARFQVRKHRLGCRNIVIHWPKRYRIIQRHKWLFRLTSFHHFRWARQSTFYCASLLGSNMLTSQCHTAIAWSNLMWSSKLFIKLSEIEP